MTGPQILVVLVMVGVILWLMIDAYRNRSWVFLFVASCLMATLGLILIFVEPHPTEMGTWLKDANDPLMLTRSIGTGTPG